MTVTDLLLVCPPDDAGPRIAELRELLTVTGVDGPFPPPAPGALDRMGPVLVPGRRHTAGPGEETTPGAGDDRVCYRIEVQL